MARKDVFQPFLDVSSFCVTSGLEFLCSKLPATVRNMRDVLQLYVSNEPAGSA